MKARTVDINYASPDIFFQDGVSPSGVMIVTDTEMHETAEAGHDKIMLLLQSMDPVPDIMMKAGKKVVDSKGNDLFLDKYSVYLTLYYPGKNIRVILLDFSSGAENTTIQ